MRGGKVAFTRKRLKKAFLQTLRRGESPCSNHRARTPNRRWIGEITAWGITIKGLNEMEQPGPGGAKASNRVMGFPGGGGEY